MRADRHAGHARARRAELRDTTRRARLSLAITPMIDVVFQLLIYFLLATSFVSGERQLRAEMPADGAAPAAQDPFALEVETLVVGVVREGARTRYRLSSGLAQPADARALAQTLRDAMLTPAQPRGIFPPDHPVRIAAAPDAPWQDVVDAFNAVMSAGYTSVAFGGRP
jgi:biopolymer transport protein ExbD